MTETEYQDLVNRVLSTLRTNSKEIENLPSVLQLSDTDSFEISKGRKVSFSTLLKHIKGYQSSEGTEDNSSNMDILQIWKELSNDSNLKLVAYDYMPDRVKSAIEWVEIIKSNDNDNAINKWNEIISFLSEVEATSLNEILKTYATKEQLESLAKSVGTINGDYIKSARKISAGTGLTGGGDLSVDRTLSLATIGKSGTYTKVIVDAYGRVTGSSTLLESDIPYLSIAKISNLQSTIDTINKKFAYYLPLSGGAMTSTKLVTNLNADLLDGVHLKDVHKSGWVHVTPYSHDTTVVKYYWFKVAQIDYAQDKAGKAVLELLAMGDNNYPYSNSAQLRIQNYCDIDDDGNLISHTSSIMLITDVHNEVHLKATIDRNGGVWVQADSCGIYSTLSWRAILEGESDYPNVQIHNGTTKQFDTPEGTIIHENEGVRYDVLNNTYISYPYNYQIGGSLTIGGANGVTLSWDTENQMLRISKGGYFLGPVSTKGVSAETGIGGTGINISRMWEELASDDATKLINLSHMPSSVKTAVNWVSSVTSSDADSQINKWNEIVDFLNGISDTSSLNSILSGKANASVVEELSDDVSALNTHITNILARKVNAGTGLTGGGDLSADRTLSLATIGTAGTYTKVVVDAYGRVTGNSALLASDIPQLEMGQINGLANELEAYSQLIESSVQESEFAAFFAQEMAKWFVLDSENKGIKTANGYGFYSESYISSKGLSNETGTGGTGVDLSAVWDSLANNTDAYGSTKIHLDHIPTLTKSKISDFPSLVSAFANDAGYITASAIINKADKATTLAGYGITDAVTLNTEQTITRVKTFTNGIKTPIIVNQTSDNALFIGATDNYYCDLNTQLSPGYSAIIPLFQKIGSATSTTGDFGSARKGVIRLSGNASESQLLFDHYNATIHYRGSTSNGAFTEWKRIAFLDDVVTLSGNQTITGEKVFQTGGGSNVPLRIRNTADSAHIQAGSSAANNTASLTISGLGRSMLNSLQVYATNTAFHGSISTTKISGITDSSVVANLHAQYSTNLMGDDNRNVNEAPYSYGTCAVNWRFKRAKAIGLATNDSEYAGVLHLTPWNDSTGGPDHQLAFESNGKIKYRSGLSTWSDWTELLTDANGVTLGTEQEITGTKTFTANPIVNNSSARFTANNGSLSGFFGFSGNVIGAYSTSLAEWLISASTSAVCIAPQSKVNVGVKTWTPAYDFHVNGSIGANSLTIGQATISWDSTTQMLKVNTGAYFTGPVSTKGVSGGSGLVAVAQFGITWHDAWAIDANSTYVESFGTTNKSIIAGQSTTNGSTIEIVSDAFAGKKIGDIEIFTLGWEGEYPADARLVPYKIVGNELSCKLYLTGTMTPILFKIKIY